MDLAKGCKELNQDDLVIVQDNTYSISCCRSYTTPKGRCYSCPEHDDLLEDDVLKEHDPDVEELYQE